MKTNSEIAIYNIAREFNISPSTESFGLKDHIHIRNETKKKIIVLEHKLIIRESTIRKK